MSTRTSSTRLSPNFAESRQHTCKHTSHYAPAVLPDVLIMRLTKAS